MYDIVIKGGTVFSGNNEEGHPLDIAISGDKIKKIGVIKETKGRQVINAHGKYITPGFIDIQNHSDGYWTLFKVPGQESLLRQGVTTIVGGSDGSSVAPLPSPRAIETIRRWVDIRDITVNWMTLAELFDVLERSALGVNFATLTGHLTLRRGLIHDENRKLRDKELAAIEKMFATALKEGSYGFSTALAFSHASLTDLEELKPFLELAYKEGGVYATHLRSEGDGFVQAVEEAISAARTTKVSLLISHLKVKGEESWPLFDEALRRIEAAHDEGVNINFNIYPYAITGSVLYSYLPKWATEGGRQQMLLRLKDSADRTKIIAEMEADAHDYHEMMVAMSPFNEHLVGKNISEMGIQRGLSPEAVVVETLVAGNGHVIVFDRTLSEDNVKKAVTHPLSMISTSSAGYNLAWKETGQLVHPRAFGTFPRFFRQYVREEKLLTWPEAIYKVSGMPATKLGMTDRGIIAKGKYADIVVFDPEKIADKSTVETPYKYAEGIDAVIVNGRVAVEGGQAGAISSGRVLKR